MKRNMKQVMLTVLSASLVLLSGCASGGSGASTPSSTPAPSSPSNEASTNQTGLPLTNEKITLRFATTKNGQQTKPHSDLKVVKAFEEATNVQIEWDASTQGYSEKKNLMFASGDLPDVFFGPESLTENDLVRYGAQGLLMPLEELIDKHAPNIKSILEKRPDIKEKITAPDGHIYALPTIEEQEFLELSDVMFINKAWLDKLGLPVPTTTDELEAALLAFKTKDPNGNNKADEIPFTFIYGHNMMGIFSLYGAFGQPDTVDHLVLKDGKIKFTADKPEFKEAVKYFHTLYKQGLIDPESFTQDRNVMFSKGKNKDVPIVGAYVGWNQPNVVGPDRAKDYVAVTPIKGPNGHVEWNRHQAGFFARAGFAITSENKQPELSIRWADELYKERNSLEWNWGPFGLTMEEADGKLKFKPTPEGMSFDDFRTSEAPGGTTARILLKDTLSKLEPSADQKLRIEYWEQYKPFLSKGSIPNMMFSVEDADRLAVVKEDIYNYVLKTQSKWIVEGNVDSEWDAYLKQLDKIGLKEMIEIYQKAYDNLQKAQ